MHIPFPVRRPGATESPWRVSVSAPDLSGNEEAYVAEAVRSGWVSSTGQFLERFEREFAAACGTTHALACSSGTTALHLALAGLGVGPGDEVIVPATTFVATANAVRFCGGTPVFVDIDPDTWCLDPRGVAAAVGRRTKGIVPVHLLGHPADMDALAELAAEHGLWMVEDAAEATFATHRGRPVGSLGEAAIFSFFGNKIITSGEGGAVTCSHEDLVRRMRMLRGHGMDPERKYHFPEVGFNYRMSNVTAALACGQFERRELLLARRREIVRRYEDRLQGVPGLIFRRDAAWAGTVPWLFAVQVEAEEFGLDRDGLARSLADRGIETRPLFPPLHRLPRYHRGHRGSLPHAERLGATGIMLPTHPLMTADDTDFVCAAVTDACRRRRLAA